MSACNMKNLFWDSVQVLLFISLCLLGCNGDSGNNPLTPAALEGTWELVSSTNKESNLVSPAGQRTDIGNGVFVTITGRFVFTDTTFTLTTETTIVSHDPSRIERGGPTAQRIPHGSVVVPGPVEVRELEKLLVRRRLVIRFAVLRLRAAAASQQPCVE